jgi:hypothetical protein
LLPLATFSSLTEVLLNLSRGGVYNTVKGFAKASKDGMEVLTYKMVNRVMKDHNMSQPEAFRKLQRFGIAFEQAAADQVERLSGESVTNPTLQKINRGFFRLNLLEPWTKTVQLTSFNVGKDIIRDNLKAIARHGDKEPTARIQTKIDQLLELNIDIDKGLSWYNKTNGNFDIKDDFNFQIERGAARYTNEIILNPTRESGIKSLALSKNPFTSMLFQLSAYPAAFTNTILKDMVRRTARGVAQGDIGASGKVLGTALTMQGAAMMLNYQRNELFNKDKEYKNKEPNELLLDGLARWGGNGIYLDVAQRTSRASEFLGPIAGPVAGVTGPFVGQALTAAKGYTVVDPFVSMMPFYSALPKETRKEIRTGARQFEKEFIRGEKPKIKLAKGGEVLDVPNAPSEPDQRIDKMTGMPYNQQAGTAFTDIEDRQDPLQRMNFVAGGLTKIISKSLKDVIKDYSKRMVKDDEAEEAAEEILKVYRTDSDMPSELDDPEFEDFIKLETKALLEEKHDLAIDELKEKFPQFVDDQGNITGGEAFSRARDYTDDEIETYKLSGEYEDEFGDEAKAHIQDILDSKGLTQKAREPEQKIVDVLLQKKIVKESKDPMFDKEQEKTTLDFEASMLTEEEQELLKSFKVPDVPLRADVVREVDRDKALKEFLKDSKEKEPVYRGTSDGFDTDYELSFAMPRELGTHVGSKGQATSILTKYDALPKEEVSEETMLTALEQTGMDTPQAITKGYVNVKNPLVIEDDYGNWGAIEILNGQNLNSFVSAVVKQANQKGVNSEAVSSVIKRKVSPYINKVMELSQEGLEDSLSYNIYNAKLNKELQSVLKDFGFDSVKYKNKLEARIKGESPYSYILFDPEQFKSTFASKFDKADPRQNKAKGGLSLLSKDR